MLNSTLASQSMLETLSIHTEMAKGAIQIAPNPIDNGTQPASFSDMMQEQLSAINSAQNASGKLMHAVDTGASTDLVGAMIASEKAGLAFSAMMQIRNKLVQAFDEVMKMPV